MGENKGVGKKIYRGIGRRSKLCLRYLRYTSLRTTVDSIKDSPDFPSSLCNDKTYLKLTLDAAFHIYKDLSKLYEIPELRVYSVEDSQFLGKIDFEDNAITLGSFFSNYGSDKANPHDYHRVYSKILLKMGRSPERILEIGLGSKRPKQPSTMGKGGRPGASLRAWKELDPAVSVFGADIDESTLFTEDRISTFHLDQTSSQSWVSFKDSIKNLNFELIVDDGLHSPMANLKTILNSVDLLAPNSFIVVEDITENHLPVWQLIDHGIKRLGHGWMIRARKSFCYVFFKG